MEEIINPLVNNMVEYADENWSRYVDNGRCKVISSINEAESAYKRLHGEEMPHSTFWELIDHPRIEKAAKWMETIVNEHLRGVKVNEKSA